MAFMRALEKFFLDPNNALGKKNFPKEFYTVYGALDRDALTKINLIKGIIKPEEEPSFQDPTEGLKKYEQLLLAYAREHDFWEMLYPQG